MSKADNNETHGGSNVIPLPLSTNGIHVDEQGNKIVEPIFCGIGGTVAGHMAVRR